MLRLPTYNPKMETVGPARSDIGTRTVLDGVGHVVSLSLSDGMLVLCDPVDPRSCVTLNKVEAQIVHAFLSMTLRMPTVVGRSEELGRGRIVALVEGESPPIRITTPEGAIDIRPPSWEQMIGEIGLLLPRMAS